MKLNSRLCYGSVTNGIPKSASLRFSTTSKNHVDVCFIVHCYCVTLQQQTGVAHIESHGDGESDGTGGRVVGDLHFAIATGTRYFKLPLVTIFGSRLFNFRRFGLAISSPAFSVPIELFPVTHFGLAFFSTQPGTAFSTFAFSCPAFPSRISRYCS